ncbi:MAG: hypothetical protein H7330_13630 [Hymenobacteraceae bacterium]|nr:hypothetical protein [Hymenobacteraceae bacterium]
MPQSRIRLALIKLARSSGTISLLTLNNETELGLHLDSSHERARLLEMLGEITAAEHLVGRPLLSSLVRIKGTQGQADAFYRLCERLGLGEWRVLKQDEHFLEDQQRRARLFWRDDANYDEFRTLPPAPVEAEEEESDDLNS